MQPLVLAPRRAVSQVCRFSHFPKQSYAKAVKHILRSLNLKGTAGETTITIIMRILLSCLVAIHIAVPIKLAVVAGLSLRFSECSFGQSGNLSCVRTSSTSTQHSEYVALWVSLRIHMVLKPMLENEVWGLNLDRNSGIRNNHGASHATR